MSVNFGVEEKTDYIGFVYQFREKMEKGIRARKHVQNHLGVGYRSWAPVWGGGT